MRFRKTQTCLLLFLCSSNFSLKAVSVHFLSKTDLDYRSQSDISPQSVRSLSECATVCARKNGCVAFFFSLLDSLCQVEGRILLSFDGSGPGPWTYYEMRMKNVAALKPVTMSSEHTNHSPSYAVDDNVVKIGYAVECAHTLAQLAPWMLIDLQQDYNVNYITLVNRLDDVGERLRDVSIDLGATADSFPEVCGKFTGPAETAEVVHVTCERPTRGRYVKILIDNSLVDSTLTLCEIKVLVSED